MMAVSLALLTSVAPLSARTDVQTLLRKAGEQVATFEREFQFVVGTERYRQNVITSSPRLSRAIESEVAPLWDAPGDGFVWVRRAVRVDGRPVPDSGDRLDALLRLPSAATSAKVRALREESARFDIGTIHRNTNDPT